MKYSHNVLELIASDRLEEAIQVLKKLCKDSSLVAELTIQSSRLESIQKQIRLGTIEPAGADVLMNKVRLGLIDLAKNCDNNPDKIDEETSRINEESQTANKIYNIGYIDKANFS